MNTSQQADKSPLMQNESGDDIQKQAASESDRAYLAYQIYRDLGGSRSLIAAYHTYLERTRRPGAVPNSPEYCSANFKGWAKTFAWDLRVRAWDKVKSKHLQDELLKSDTQLYLDKIEASRDLLERVAITGMEMAQITINLAAREVKILADRSRGGLSPDTIDLAHLLALCKVNKCGIELLGLAKIELFEAMGLTQTLEELANLSSCRPKGD